MGGDAIKRSAGLSEKGRRGPWGWVLPTVLLTGPEGEGDILPFKVFREEGELASELFTTGGNDRFFRDRGRTAAISRTRGKKNPPLNRRGK